MTRTFLRRLALLVLLSAPVSRALELQIYFTAIQRILAAQVFTQDGRLYVHGNATNKCNFAYLEHPLIASAPPRLIIRARFSGRSARNFFGRCVGLGDSFDLMIGAVPYYRNGSIALRDVTVETPGRDGFYIRKVRAAISDSLAKQFAYNIAADAKRVLEQKRDPLYTQELKQFNVSSIAIAPDSILVTADFTIAVK